MEHKMKDETEHKFVSTIMAIIRWDIEIETERKLELLEMLISDYRKELEEATK